MDDCLTGNCRERTLLPGNGNGIEVDSSFGSPVRSTVEDLQPVCVLGEVSGVLQAGDSELVHCTGNVTSRGFTKDICGVNCDAKIRGTDDGTLSRGIFGATMGSGTPFRAEAGSERIGHLPIRHQEPLSHEHPAQCEVGPNMREVVGISPPLQSHDQLQRGIVDNLIMANDSAHPETDFVEKTLVQVKKDSGSGVPSQAHLSDVVYDPIRQSEVQRSAEVTHDKTVQCQSQPKNEAFRCASGENQSILKTDVVLYPTLEAHHNEAPVCNTLNNDTQILPLENYSNNSRTVTSSGHEPTDNILRTVSSTPSDSTTDVLRRQSTSAQSPIRDVVFFTSSMQSPEDEFVLCPSAEHLVLSCDPVSHHVAMQPSNHLIDVTLGRPHSLSQELNAGVPGRSGEDVAETSTPGDDDEFVACETPERSVHW